MTLVFDLLTPELIVSSPYLIAPLTAGLVTNERTDERKDGRTGGQVEKPPHSLEEA